MFHPASPASVLAFLLVCGFVLAAFLRGIWSSATREGRGPATRTLSVAAGVALAGLACSSGLVGSGWVAAAPAHLMIFGATTMLGSLLLGLSPIGKWLGDPSCIPWLLAFQGFRVPLELVLHSWAGQGVIPQSMTWTGSNWDILSGIAALVLAPFSRRSIALAWVGNIFGVLLLLNVGRVAVFSLPMPFGWPDVTPKLQLPLHLPVRLDRSGLRRRCPGGSHRALTRALLEY